MNNDFSFNIDDNIFNIFTSKSTGEIKTYYHINTIYFLNQIHSNIVNILDDNYINNSDGDALITNKKDTYLSVRTADCIPILIYDKEKEIIGLVHAGWRGILKGIVENTIKSIIDIYNSNPEDIKVYLYPSIRKCHFEIKEDTYIKFKEKINNINKYTTKKDDSYYIDLQQIVIDKLKELNINDILDSNTCTYCNNNIYHSYRYNHTDKRNYLLVALKEPK